MATRIKLFDKFYAGIVRDDKSQIVGALANAEEVEVFSNLDFIQAEQIMGIDTLPAGTDVFAYTAADTDIVYAYGRETAGSRVRILSTPSGGTDNPVAFTTLFTSADATNLARDVS